MEPHEAPRADRRSSQPAWSSLSAEDLRPTTLNVVLWMLFLYNMVVEQINGVEDLLEDLVVNPHSCLLQLHRCAEATNEGLGVALRALNYVARNSTPRYNAKVQISYIPYVIEDLATAVMYHNRDAVVRHAEQIRRLLRTAYSDSNDGVIPPEVSVLFGEPA